MSLRRLVFAGPAALAPLVLALACGPEGTSELEALGQSVQAYTAQTELISNVNCTSRSGRLYSCTIANRTLQGLPVESAVPLRTVLTAKRTGNCATQYPLEVTLKTAGADDVKFPYLSQASAKVKRRDGKPMTAIALSDSSSWTPSATFDASCRVSLTIVSNEPDVDSKAQAEAILASIQQQITEKTALRERYRELTLFHRGFQFMQSIAENFRVELTNETIQALREGALGALDSVSALTLACDSTMTDVDRQNVMLLFMTLPALGSADSWRNADGSTKTLGDLVGSERAQEVLATVQKLAADRDGDGGVNYDALYQAAALEVATLEARLELARTQLASWLR